jgi:hypothetical protein
VPIINLGQKVVAKLGPLSHHNSENIFYRLGFGKYRVCLNYLKMRAKRPKLKYIHEKSSLKGSIELEGSAIDFGIDKGVREFV